MLITSKDALPKLSKDELWAVIENIDNSTEIRDAALELWLALDSQDAVNSMKRMKALIAQAKRDFSDLAARASAKNKR